MSPLGTTSPDYAAASLGRHTGAKAVCTLSLELARLIGPLHGCIRSLRAITQGGEGSPGAASRTREVIQQAVSVSTLPKPSVSQYGVWITAPRRYRLRAFVAASQRTTDDLSGRLDRALSVSLWDQCLRHLEGQLPEQQLNTWIRPLQAVEDGATLRLYAPNRFVLDWVQSNFFALIEEIVRNLGDGTEAPAVSLEIGSAETGPTEGACAQDQEDKPSGARQAGGWPQTARGNKLHPGFTFDSFVKGKSNELAVAATRQVAQNPGEAYNPLFLYGGVGLGKTHLMHAVGNELIRSNPRARVVYLHSEGFVAEMVKALQHNTIDEFKRFYRSVDALLIDDIQFFAGKDRSQEEFFHTFNALLEGDQQVILSCDRYPKEVNGLEERLKSRFGWGLTTAIEPPELETRAAILMKKAEQADAELPEQVAFFVAKRIRSNVRELEGALRRIVANARFTGQPITLEFAKDALKDLLALQAKLVTIENIQKTVAEYFKIRVADLRSKGRTRSIAQPRQIAMALAKELTNHSLPEIGDAFGGRDHTTVMHACRKVQELRSSNAQVEEDYLNLLRTLTS